jgi:acyl carrier protein
MEIHQTSTQQVLQIITDKLGVSQDLLSPGTSFSMDLGIDSLDICELLLTIEKEFKINITDEDAEKLTTVGALINFVDNAYAARQ